MPMTGARADYIKMAYFRLFLFLFLIGIVKSQGPNPLVRVASGILQGTWKVSTNGRNYASFLGIPYAKPPVGKYRFREPQPVKPWAGVWDATRALSDCLQYDPFRRNIAGSEDCLFINVNTPNPNAGALMPVVIFIHGGAFMYGGGGGYSAVHLMDRDMVFVTLNYRLGPLGFLSTEDEVIPGNAGLKDQALALKWIHDNIMMFGGNPHSVTLTGCSAGGASVHYQYLTPLSKGTFHRGIAFSGSAFSSWTYAVKPAQKAKALAAIVGCPTTTTREMAECLKYRPGEVIVNAQIEMFDWKLHWFTPFTPTVEAPGTRDPFLSQYPYIASQAGAMHPLPLITSVTSEEGLYPAASYQTDPTILPELESRWEHLASNIFEYNDTLPLYLRATVAQKIKEKYLGGKPVGQDTFAGLVQALGDRIFLVGVGKLAQIHAQRSGKPTYLYRYSYRAENSLSDLLSQSNIDYGVSHADDILLLLVQFPSDQPRPADQQMREALIDMIYSYANTGVPRIPNGPEWSPVRPGQAELDYLEITGPKSMEMKTSADFGNRAFWDSLGFNENENYRVNIRDEL
ncbi:venom carboxylesterase-6-like isoform X1 [Maniola jurtina]|uniref:venom carboxylesterase-6-like isoform X1 n=1 Tax=Maniola jurtina TaxID=191418 RepID=UPI001E68AB67|nr:venom carboxylesterase-6-like isoform X1 [Maniola jurtina]XP_045772635.1 venom carboxylesterase-6-like isoform X1 [Maniola jurtina]